MIALRRLFVATLLVFATAPLQAQAAGQMLASGISAYNQLEFTAAARFLDRALSAPAALDPAARTQGRSYLAATMVFLDQPDSAAAIFRAMLVDDPRYRIDELVFPPQVSSLFDRVRRGTQAVALAAPSDTTIAQDGNGYVVRAYATSFHEVRAEIVDGDGGVVDTVYEGPIGDSLVLRWNPRRRATGATVPSGPYALRVWSSDFSGRAVRRIELPLDITALSGEAIPPPAPPADSVLLPERGGAGPGMRALFGGLVLGAAIAGLPGAIAADADLSQRRFGAAAAVSVAGIVGFILQRPGRVLQDNVASNEAIRAAWRQRVEEVRAENLRRQREAGVRIRVGEPRVIPPGPR